jgi:hypothetical protein
MVVALGLRLLAAVAVLEEVLLAVEGVLVGDLEVVEEDNLFLFMLLPVFENKTSYKQ